MVSTLSFFGQQLTHQMMGYVVTATVIGGLISLFKRDVEDWIVKKLRNVFHPRTNLEQDDPPPACPQCRKPMVKRTAKRGLKRDSQFWGCSTFPGCRGTRTIA